MLQTFVILAVLGLFLWWLRDAGGTGPGCGT